MPKVSVVIATFNRSRILQDRALRSIQNQTFKDWECLVVDDGSTDDTENIVKEAMKRDQRLRYFKKPNGGQASARNFGIRNSRGEYIAITDDDDEFLPGYLEAAVNTFKKLPEEITYLSCGTIIRDARGAESYFISPLEPFWKYAIGNGWFFKRKVFFEDNLFLREGVVGFEDMEHHIRFHFSGQKGYVIQEPLRVYYTAIGSRAHSWSKNYNQQRRDFEIFFKNNRMVYENAGPEALAWICRFGAVVNLQSGAMKQGRELLRMSFFAKPSLFVTIYFVASLFGHRFFIWFDYVKSRIMRFVRLHLSHPLPRQ